MKMRSIKEAGVGDTLIMAGSKTEALSPSFCKATPMLYAGVFPLHQSEHVKLRAAIEKLTLNDNAVTLAVDSR